MTIDYVGPVATVVDDFVSSRADLAKVLEEAQHYDHELRFAKTEAPEEFHEPPAMLTSVKGEIVFHARFRIGNSDVYVREEYHESHIRHAVLISGDEDYIDIFKMVLAGTVNVLGDIGTPEGCFASLGELDISNISVHGDEEGKPYLIATRNIWIEPLPAIV